MVAAHPFLAEQSWLSYEGWLLFFKGTWVGLAVTAPPGPVGGLAVRRTVREGIWAGVLTALGALLADVCLGAIAMVPSSQFKGLGKPWDAVVAVAVAVVLTWLGVKIFRRALTGQTFDQSAADQRKGAGLLGLTVGTFALTLMTPGTIPAFLMFFTTLQLGRSAKELTGGPLLVLSGVAVGAAVWWVLLCGLVHRFRAHAQGWLRGLEFVCAGLMFVGAAFAVWKGLLS